ncbi:MAG: Zn-ribbon domain-containing OB-fold protein [Gammaproteobacteria bacterium]
MTASQDEELLARFPDTRIDHDNKHFYAGWLQKKLLLNRCEDCGHWHTPPRPLCPKCWSFKVKPTEVSGRGTVHLLIRLHQGPPAPGVDYKTPHPVATVELPEQPGLRISSTVVNCAPQDIRIGMPVKLTWIDRYGAPYPVFEPAEAR